MMKRNKNRLLFLLVMALLLAYGLLIEKPGRIKEPQTARLEAPGAAAPRLTPPLIDKGGLVRREGLLMGTQFVFVVHDDYEKANDAIVAAAGAIKHLERKLSSWIPGSDISRINELAGIAPVKVDKETFALLQLSRELHSETKGAFDVTVGALWDLWPFRAPRRALPTAAKISENRPLVNASLLALDSKKSTAYLPHRGMKINLGAIGKGYAAGRAMEVMKGRGIAGAAISAGGDLFLLGEKTFGPWVVGIENPRWKGAYIERFAAGDVAVATSGDSERFIERQGKRYHHIIDPVTGYPAEGVQSVTVMTKEPARADAYATALFVMGVERGLGWIETRQDAEALFVDGQGRLHRSSGWEAMKGRKAPVSYRPEDPPPHTGGEAAKNSVAAPPAGEAAPFLTEGEVEGMVTIPAGRFLSASSGGEKNVRRTYRIDVREVTNEAYGEFVEALEKEGHAHCHPEEPAGKDHQPRYWREFRSPLFQNSVASKLAPFNEETFRKPAHPVVGVDWWDAYAYAAWAGKRLPSREEWEKAAGGPFGHRWPWGDQWEYSRANTGGEKWGEQDGYTYSAPAESFAAGRSFYGALNMAGNVAEWTAERYVMGGSSNSNPSEVTTGAGMKREADYRAFDVGFRCAAPGEEGLPE